MKAKHYITDGTSYIVREADNTYSLSTDVNKACIWDTSEKAENFLKAFPKNIKRKASEFKALPVEDKIDKIELSFEIDSFIDEMAEKTNVLKKRHSYLLTELSRLDKERVDIEHAAEFYNLSAAQGYKLYKRLHDNAVARREVKDELYKISSIFSNQMNSEGIEIIKKSIKGLENREYNPRISPDLFK